MLEAIRRRYALDARDTQAIRRASKQLKLLKILSSPHQRGAYTDRYRLTWGRSFCVDCRIRWAARNEGTAREISPMVRHSRGAPPPEPLTIASCKLPFISVLALTSSSEPGARDNAVGPRLKASFRDVPRPYFPCLFHAWSVAIPYVIDFYDGEWWARQGLNL